MLALVAAGVLFGAAVGVGITRVVDVATSKTPAIGTTSGTTTTTARSLCASATALTADLTALTDLGSTVPMKDLHTATKAVRRDWTPLKQADRATAAGGSADLGRAWHRFKTALKGVALGATVASAESQILLPARSLLAATQSVDSQARCPGAPSAG